MKISTAQPAAGAQHVRPDQALGLERLELLAQHRLLRPVLVADEDPALLTARDEHAQQEALDHEMRLLGHDLTVLERAGLGLVRVADRVVRGGVLRGHELPLAPGREPGAAHAAQAGVLHRGQDLVGRQLAAQ